MLFVGRDMDDLPRIFRFSATERDLLGYDERKAILRAREVVAGARATRPITIDDLPHDCRADASTRVRDQRCTLSARLRNRA